MANGWLEHVKKTMKLHPGKPFKEVLKLAKKTYGAAEKSVGKMVGKSKKRSRSSRKGKKSMKGKKSRRTSRRSRSARKSRRRSRK